MRLWFAVALLAPSLPAQSAPPAPSDVTAVPVEAELQVKAFLALLVAGKGSDAIDGVLKSSPLFAQKTGARESMVGQVDAAIRAYGPVMSYERAHVDTLGTTVIREYYLVQHRDIVVRWEFDLVHAGTGWQISYFGFSDQVTTWF